MRRVHSQLDSRLNRPPLRQDEPPPSNTIHTPTPCLPNTNTNTNTTTDQYSSQLARLSSQFISLLTDMQPPRKPFRSLRSFTHAARHRSTPSEIVSDPILDYNQPNTPEKLNHIPLSPNFHHLSPPTSPPQVFDLEDPVDPPDSPVIKRRRTRSSSRRHTHSSPSPQRKSKHSDVEWLRTSYDSVEEVALTPSPQKPKPKTRSNLDTSRTKPPHALVERIHTSESPERITQRRSRRSNRSRATRDARVETIHSSSSPAPKKRRSRRLARISELPPQHASDSDSHHSQSSAEIVVEKTKRSNGISRSRPLPRPKAGVLQERLRRRTPLLPIAKKSSGKLRKQPTSPDARTSHRDGVALRRSKRLRNSHPPSPSIVDVDADDEVIAEGSADDENEDDRSSYEVEEESEDDAEDEEDENDSDIPLHNDDHDEGDDEDDDVDEDFEERAWREEFKRKQINRKRKRKRNGRRKRTQPRDVFRTQGKFLTASEQKERLDFLVQQSAEIASHLHRAMGDASNRSSATSNALTNQSTETAARSGESAKNKEGGDVDAPNNANCDAGNNDPEEQSNATRKEEIFVPPSGSGCELQPHQKEGVDWLLTLDAQGLNAILADEMGLGKTIQAISFVASLVLSGSRGPHLVVAPKNVCQHWVDEVRKWYPTELTVVMHLGNAEDRLEKLKYVLEEDSFDILVTSFDHALADLFSKKRREGLSWEHIQVLRAFRKVEFEYLVVDEAHRLKNDASKTNLGIRGYSLAQRRLLLTGTPLSNDLKELWSLMNVLNPRIFSSKSTFETWFSAPFASKTKKRSKVSLTHAEQSVIVDRLHTVIRPFFRRRERADICPTFTSSDEVVIRCPLSALQRALLLHLQRRATSNSTGINNVIMAMRAASNHPYIVSEALYGNEQALASERLVANSGKFVFLHFALPRMIKSGHRVLIFSQFKRVLDFIEDLLIMLDLKFGRLDGETSSDDRTNGLIEFNREGSDVPVFLLTTRAGGIGLNLQTADTVILFDSDWNPSADLQAVSRIQRIGQKKTVHILRLVAEKSVDDLIVETARHKLRTQNVAVGAGKFNTSMGAALDTRIRQKDLEELLKKLEVQNYAEDQEEVAQNVSQGNDSPESLSPTRVSRTARNRRFEEWGNQLLRKGESALSSVDNAPIWINDPTDHSDSGIPYWLAKDADLQSAATALRSSDASSASRVYEDNLLMKTEAGSLSKKDRAIRARRQISGVSVIDISDADSENETERSSDPSVDENALSGAESNNDDDFNEEAEMEKQVPEKSTSRGIVNLWTGKQVNNRLLDLTDPVSAASASMGSLQTCGVSNLSHRILNDGAAPTQSTNKSPDGSIDVWGLPSAVTSPPLAQKQVGSQKQHQVLRTENLKPLIPTHPGRSQRGRKKKYAIGSGSRMRNGTLSGGTRRVSQPTSVDPSQQDSLRNGSSFVPKAPPVPTPPTLRGSWDPETTVIDSRMPQTVFGPAALHSPRVGSSSGKDSGPIIPVFGQHTIAARPPTGFRRIPHVIGLVGHRSIQENGISQDRSRFNPAAKPTRQPHCARQRTPAKVSSGARATDLPRPQVSTCKKIAPRRPTIIPPGEVEIASSTDLCEDFWFVDNGVATELTVSVRPASSKSPRSQGKDSRKVSVSANRTQRSSVETVDVQKQKRVAKTGSEGSPGNAGKSLVRSTKPVGQDQLAARVEKLREMTKILDTEFLTDALLDCDYDTEAARKMVLRQMT